MPLNPDRSGQARALMVLTPILPGREGEVRAYLAGLRGRPSPLVKLPRTHFARWLVISDWVQDPAQPRPDHLDVPYLVFTSNLDGPVDSYLDELTERLSEEAAELWGRCVGCPRPATGPPLKRYLLHNRIRTGQFVAAYPRATVAQVKEGLRLREQVITFAVRAQGLAPAELQKAFREEFTH